MSPTSYSISSSPVNSPMRSRSQFRSIGTETPPEVSSLATLSRLIVLAASRGACSGASASLGPASSALGSALACADTTSCFANLRDPSCSRRVTICASPCSSPIDWKRLCARSAASSASSALPVMKNARDMTSRQAAWLEMSPACSKSARASAASCRTSRGRESTSSAWASMNRERASRSRCCSSSSRQRETASPAAERACSRHSSRDS
mmetsp:Transcript_71719/g.214103  ORF Transcript_71719/g.214103 Transcript_71719/m.214103 type:complete len:209 (+) Transcript_71719:277-903(+)